MRTYRLKKIYPGSEAIGYERSFEDWVPHQITSYPEFWEKITKDYEILSFKSKISGRIAKLNGEKYKCDNFSFTENEMLQDDISIINSVKRLSDNKVFTIGDEIKHNRSSYDHGKLSKIDFNREGRQSSNVLIFHYGTKFWNDISVLEHSKKLLFQTEDKVDIFEDEIFFALNSCNYSIFKCEARPKNGENWNIIFDGDSKLFSTEKAAQGYVDLNKPKYSELEMKDARVEAYQDGLRKLL